MPHYLISEILLSEDLVHKNLDIMPDVIVEMHIYACRVAHHGFDGHKVFVHPVEIAFLVPDVAVHLLLEILKADAAEEEADADIATF